MSMTDWAKREVEIACKREAPDRKADEWDYGCSCYESALKAYLSLMEDEHSGMSFSFTTGILKRLLESKTLTPIEDVPEVWMGTPFGDDARHYQCKRMSSLFKEIKPDGTVEYSDVGRYYCKDVDTGATYTCGLEARILNEMHPITMPYFPPLGQYVFTTSEFLTDRKNGDFDTKAIYDLKAPDGTTETINRFFAQSGNGWREIDIDEFVDRLHVALDRRTEDEHLLTTSRKARMVFKQGKCNFGMEQEGERCD